MIKIDENLQSLREIAEAGVKKDMGQMMEQVAAQPQNTHAYWAAVEAQKDEAMSEPKVVSAVIGPMPKNMRDDMPKVTATFDDGETKELFSFYPDEITFVESELLGLTRKQVGELRTRKDVAYLRS